MCALRSALAGGLVALTTLLQPVPVSAGERPALMPFLSDFSALKGRGEFSNGFDASGNAWSAYSSAVFALTGPLHQNGWRLKLSGVYSQYRNESRNTKICKQIHYLGQTDPNPTLDKICDYILNTPPDQVPANTHDFLAAYGLHIEGDQITAVTQHQATKYFLGAAPGYQTALGALVVKAYLGFAFERQDVAPPDPWKSLDGGYWGAQGWIESWLPLGEAAWISADASYFTGTSSYSAAMKLGYKPLAWLSAGPEFAAYGDDDDMSGRAGAFLRFDAFGLETTLSAGVSGAYKTDPAAYGSAGVYVKF